MASVSGSSFNSSRTESWYESTKKKSNGVLDVLNASYNAGRKATPSAAQLIATGGSDVDIWAALQKRLVEAQSAGRTKWVSIKPPEKATPGATKTVEYSAQRALRQTVTEADSKLPASLRDKPFDAGRIGQNAGRVVLLGALQPNDAQDVYKISLISDGKLKIYAPNPKYDSKVAGSKADLGDAQIELIDSKGAVVATTDVRNSQGFANWIALNTENFAKAGDPEGAFPGLKLAKGDYTIRVTRDNPPELFKVGINDSGELDFTGTVLNDAGKIGSSIQPTAGAVTVTNSEGAEYKANYVLVKKSEGGEKPAVKDGDPARDPNLGYAGGPDVWQLQLVGLTAVNKDAPAPKVKPTTSNPLILGDFALGGVDAEGKPKPSVFTPTGAKVEFVNIVSTPGEEGEKPTETILPAKGELTFGLKDPDALFGDPTPVGKTVINPGDIKISMDGARNVSSDTRVDYTIFAVMGDPGATTFYTVKSEPKTAQQKFAEEQQSTVTAAQKAATQNASSGAVLSLFA